MRLARRVGAAGDVVREVVGVLVMDVGGLEGRGEVIVDILCGQLKNCM